MGVPDGRLCGIMLTLATCARPVRTKNIQMMEGGGGEKEKTKQQQIICRSRDVLADMRHANATVNCP